MNRSRASKLGRRLLRGTSSRLRQTMLRHRLRPAADTQLVRLGSAYGGWWVPAAILRPGTTAYCAGAGEDITFDLALYEHGCSVTVFDPTPRAIAHVLSTAPQDPRFRFLPVGWWSTSQELRFFAPTHPEHVSHSVVNLQGSTEWFSAPVRPVAELMTELGDTKVDLIKMDIEGAEQEVLTSMLSCGPIPEVLCVEFDQPQRMRRMVGIARRLEQRGLRLAKIEGWNLTFVATQSVTAN